MTFRTLAALAFVFSSLPVFAQLGTHGYDLDTRQWQPPGVVVNNQQGQGQGRVVYSQGGIIQRIEQPVYTSGVQQVLVPQGTVSGQQFVTSVGGVQQRCTLPDRALSAGAQGLLAGGIGYIAERLFNRDNHRWSATLATGGLLAGATITCDPAIYNDGDQQVVQRQQSAVNQGIVPQVAQPQAQQQQQGLVLQGQQQRRCPIGDSIIDVQPWQDCRNIDAAVRSVGGRTYNGSAMPAMPGSVQSQQQPQVTQRVVSGPAAGRSAIEIDGRKCAYEHDGIVVEDFFDKTRNSEGILIPSEGAGPTCVAAKARAKAKYEKGV